MRMTLDVEIRAIENRLAAAGFGVEDACGTAGIARSTWSRWKSGKTSPNMATWRNVQEAVDLLCHARSLPSADARGAA